MGEVRCINFLAGRPRNRSEWICCCLSYLPVLFVFALIVWILTSYLFCFCLSIMQQGLVQQGGIYGAGAIVTMGLLLVSYLRACLTSPGYVVDGWEKKFIQTSSHVFDLEAHHAISKESKMRGGIRFCRKCNVLKPDRSHHCSDCCRCVKKMDHHCPWINNCVGFNNQKFFLLFLMYIPISALWVTGTGLYQFYSTLNFAKLSLCYVNFLVSLLVAGIFGTALLMFFGFTIKMVLDNQTTIELMEKSAQKSVWSLGPCQNFRQVFGPDWRLWFLPVSTPVGDGNTFPSREASV
eukprot:NODE_3403_length_974_cov_45.664699_g3256_i0.p1 GENE.NODE_3403_length_974_cov_45.664699_g3256_i0~~NODE_3403_length_974_cov_45.664699_g3256_i0.p1  ORF type:complete len:293 (+),score=74.74 NODE_3403_length_974_cov_45.664699_g3256_i0:51-929(+)